MLAEITALRESVDHLNHVVGQLNHDVRAGSPEELPLFLGFAERLRTDAESMISAAVLIDRQLRRLEHDALSTDDIHD